MGFAARALRIRAGELRITAMVVATMFVALSTIAVGESAISALTLDRIGTDALPALYLAQAASTLVAMFALTAVIARVRPRLVYIGSPLVLASVVIVERGVLLTGARWIYPVLWMTVASATLAQAIGLWGTAGAVVDTRQAKRLFPLFGAGGILGSVVGGLLTRPLAAVVGAENLLFVWAGGLVVASVLCRMALRSRATTARPIATGRRGSVLGDVRAGWGFVRKSRLLVAMAAAAVLFSVLFYSLYLPFATAATERFHDADELAGFFGLVWAALTGSAFLISVVLTNRLFSWFGVAAMVLVLPLLYGGAFGTLLLASGLVVIVSLRLVTGVWLQGVASPAWETLVNVVPDDRRDQTRAFLNGGPSQVGTAIAGLVAIVGQDVLSPRQFAAIGIVASVLTIVTALAIRRSYVDALLQALRAGRPQVFEKASTWTAIPLDVDAQAIEVLADAMRSDDVHLRRMAFELAADLRAPALAGRIALGLDDPDAIVRLASLRAVDRSTAETAAALRRMIDDPVPAVGAAAAALALGTTLDAEARGRLDRLLQGPEASVRRAAIEQLGLAPPAAGERLARPMLGDPEPEVRAAALERVTQAAPDQAVEVGVAGMRDPDPGVRLAAGRALGVGGPSAVGPVLAALADPRTSEAAIEAVRRLEVDGEVEAVRGFVRSATVRARRDQELAAEVPRGGEAELFLRDAIVERGRGVARCALWALTMLAPSRTPMETAIECLDGASWLRADALETLEIAGDPQLVRPLLLLWEPITPSGPQPGTWLERALEDEDALIRMSAEMVRARREGDGMARSPETLPAIERALLLRRVPLFAELAPGDLERLARIAEERGYGDDETIASQGELGQDLHVVIDGAIRVVQDDGGGGRDLARRTAGEVVGEMSIITRAPRVASLVADGPVRTIRIGHREFEGVLRERPEVALAMMRVLATRLAESTRSPDPDVGGSEPERRPTSRPEEQP